MNKSNGFISMADRMSPISSGSVDRRGSMTYEAIRSGLVPRTTPVARSVVSHRDQLADVVRDSIRQVTRSATGLSAKEAQLLKDIARGRYIGGVLHALEISQQRCEDVADATAIPEAFRGWVLGGHPRYAVCVFDSFVAEQESNGEFDVAQMRYMRDPTPANRDRAIEAGNRQLVETRRALDALHQGT